LPLAEIAALAAIVNSQQSMVRQMTLLSSKRAYSGKRINVDVDRVRFPDGSVGTLKW
jgi:hypothetical protein